MNSAYGKYFTKMALAWAGCFVLFFLAYMLVLVPQKKNRAQYEKQLESKKQIYEVALKSTQEDIQAQFSEELGQLRNELKSLVVDFEDAANLTFDISKIAGEKSIDSFSITTKKGAAIKGRGKGGNKYISESNIDISFSVTEFNQFASMLNALERHQPVIFVDRFSISRSGRGGSAHRVRMNLAVIVKKMQAG